MEDLGYFCVDNLPPSLLLKMVELCSGGGMKIDHLAAVIEGLTGHTGARDYLASHAAHGVECGDLASGRDRATAHKLLAFITCTSERIAECEAAFVAARQADPAFALSRSEQGHPLWGPVYRRVLP